MICTIKLAAFRAKWLATLVVAVLAALWPRLSPAQGSPTTQWLYSPVTSVSSEAFSPNGTVLAMAGIGGIHMYTLATGAQAWLPTRERYWSVAFSPDSKTLYAAMSTGVELWSVSTSKLLNTFSAPAGYLVISVAASSDGKTLAMGGYTYNTTYDQYEGLLQLWNVSTGKSTATLNTYAGEVWAVAFSPNGLTLADGGTTPGTDGNSSYGSLEMWTVSTGKRITSLNTSATFVESVAFSPDGKSLADGGSNGSGSVVGVLELWNVSTQAKTAALGTKASGVNGVAFSPDGKTLADGGYTAPVGGLYGVLELWNVSTDKPESSYSAAGTAMINTVQYSPNGETFADGGTNANSSAGLVDVWDVANGAQTASVNTAAEGRANSVAFSANGSMLAVAGLNTLTIWNTTTGLPTEVLNSSITTGVAGVAVSPDGTMLADCGANEATGQGIVELWQISTGKLLRTFPTSTSAALTIAFLPSGKTLVDGGYIYNSNSQTENGIVELWTVATGALAKSFYSYASAVVSLACSPDGTEIAYGGATVNNGQASGVLEMINVAKLSTTALSTTTTSLDFVTFSSNSQTLYDAGRKQINVVLESWSVPAGKAILPATTVTGARQVLGMTASATEPILVAATDLNLDVLSTANFALLSSYSTTGLTSVALSSNSEWLAYASSLAVVLAANPYYGGASVSALTVTPASVTGGATSTGKVTLAKAAPTGGDAVTLTSSSGAAALPSLLIVPAGATSVTFAITTSAVAAATTATISAASDGYSKSAPLTIEPPALVSVAVNPTKVQGSSSTAVTGTVTISGPAPAGGLAVTLKVSNSAAATVPASVTVAAGKTSATFTVSHSKVTSQASVTITATLESTSKTATLTVTP